MSMSVNVALFVDVPKGSFSLTVIDNLEMLREFRALLQRGLNTYDDAPRWLFDLCDALEEKPIPKVAVRMNDADRVISDAIDSIGTIGAGVLR